MHSSLVLTRCCCHADVSVLASGFGRIGRNFLRCLEGRGKDTLLEVIAINDSGGVKQVGGLDHNCLCLALQLRPAQTTSSSLHSALITQTHLRLGSFCWR
jgi:hypothetical protein